jgi:hypothetical protein
MKPVLAALGLIDRLLETFDAPFLDDLGYCRKLPIGTFSCVALHGGREIQIAQVPNNGRPLEERNPYPIEMSAKWQMPGAPTPDAPPPVFRSWSDYLAETSVSQRMKRCHAAAKKANAKRLMSDSPKTRLSGHDVWAIVEAPQGRCTHCGSLAVENRPSNPTTGAPVPWAHVGRRIGSLEHLQSRYSGGGNASENLAWACLWCNDHKSERRQQAADHGDIIL